MEQPARQRFWIGLTVAACLITAASTGLVLARITGDDAGPVATALPVVTRPVEQQVAFTMRRAFTGRVQARRTSTLGFESSGRLDRVYVDEGDQIKAGTLLAELDTDRLEARRTELVAAEAEATANLALADATLKRLQGVVDQGGVSRQGLDEAREGRRAAGAALRLAQQRIATIDVDLAKSRLVAPFGGTVIARQADEGRVLGSGEVVLQLQDDAVPEIRIGIAGPSLEQLTPGQYHVMTWHGKRLDTRLRALLPVRAATARTVDALFDPVDSQAAPLPGDTVTLHLDTRVEQTGSWLPLDALAAGERGLWSVLVATPDPHNDGVTHRIERRAVDVLFQTSDRVYVRSTLSEGELVVVSGLHRIVPGQAITPVPATSAPPTAAPSSTKDRRDA